MEIYLNGQKHLLPEQQSLRALLQEANWLGKRIAVELNGEVVPRSAYDATRLVAGDRLEVVVAVGGG